MKRSTIIFSFTILLTVFGCVWIGLTKNRSIGILDIFLFIFGSYYITTSVWAFIFKKLYIKGIEGRDILEDQPTTGITAILMGVTILIGGLIVYILPFFLF